MVTENTPMSAIKLAFSLTTILRKSGHLLIAVPLLLPGMFFGLPVQLLAQSRFAGKIIASDGKPVPQATIQLSQDSMYLETMLADEQGQFQFTYLWQGKGTYHLAISCAGYSPLQVTIYPANSRAGIFILQKSRVSLAAVTVTAKTPMLTRKADRLVVNVEGSYLANGNNGLELLQKTPGIWVDNEGNIRIKGNQNAVVMINDMVQSMPSNELADFLKTFKSEDISRIEIIQNPSAEFEAAGTGGIVHIILKKNKKKGWNGAVNAVYRYQGKEPYIATGFTLHYRRKQLDLSAGYNFVGEKRYIREKTAIYYTDSGNYNNQTDRREYISYQQFRLGLIYDLSPAQTLSFQTTQTFNNILQHFFTARAFSAKNATDSGTDFTGKDRVFAFGSSSVIYILKLDSIGSSLKFLSDFSSNNKTENNRFLQQKDGSAVIDQRRNNTPFSTNNFTVQTDFTKTIRKNFTWKAGLKYVSNKRDNTIITEDYLSGNWHVDSGQTDRFIYSEKLMMLYGSADRSWNSISLQVGLRAERTFSSGNSESTGKKIKRDYLDLFPSLFFTKTLDAKKGNAIFANYSRRLRRPTLRDLNPFRQQFSIYTAVTGNPDLLPEYANSFSAGYRLRQNYSVELYYTHTRNLINLSAYPGPDNSIDYLTENTSRSNELGINCSVILEPAKNWTITNNGSFFHTRYQFAGLPQSQTVLFLGSSHTIKTGSGFEIDASAAYRSPFRYTNIYTYSTFQFDAGLSKKINKGNGRIRLFIADLFNSLREKELTEAPGATIAFYRKRQSRYATISISWNFSTGKKFQTRTLEQVGGDKPSAID